ncbi:TfoX/Sxy family protein [Actinoplanes derwentensis]|uniref:YjbR protein n=1 Tax=Actinoplanes derwentensis TaxID=113562 RepID=A0A1H2DDS7_9ACTN|nr:TfoX/Sxy family protein [Actinoplanes derwentensis]GID84869.1 RNA methyltransferase [Actinoplanes derwentensis]SDT80905.1 YjbR protein [Actinoplanes derwentensis]
MAYDRELADRIREALSGRAVREVAMFGGLTFMVNDKLTATANTQGDLMIRCDPVRVEELLERDGANWPVMRGRKMSKGWIVVESDRLESDDILTAWIQEAIDYNGKVTGCADK